MAKINGYLTDKRILVLVVIAIALLALDIHYGLHFGISFEGGVQIPVQLAHPVNSTTMSELISVLDQRASTFGLSEVTVEGVGDSEIYVTVPKADNSTINKTISILDSQGRFDGVVNGRLAVSGSDIIRDTIGQVPPAISGKNVTWAVTFSTTQSSATSFAKIVYGDANYPLYMFLDRPLNATILINSSILGNATDAISSSTALSAMKTALTLGNSTIPVIAVSNSNASIAGAESFYKSNIGRYKVVYASYNLNKSLISYIRSLNYTVNLESKKNMTPAYSIINASTTVLETWPLVGLLSAPLLNPEITDGNVTEDYEISGEAPTTLPLTAKTAYATNESKTIASILSGGALPVSIIVGTPTTVPQTLGADSFEISFVALGLAIISLSAFIAIRYRRIFLVGPILLTTFMELFIILSIIGLIGTIDLAAFAGIIAVVGTGVDAQIIITDEMLSNSGQTSNGKLLLSHAFYIVWMDAALLVIAMLPLFFSTSLVTIVGFSEAAIIGVIMGIAVTRPAYGAIISRHYS
ncbi:preprotein translocase subunit SecD [Candidatus Mancarchaeum acidiphilum]|uniref:Preprotein translocase subunit SecD n=1 Tax=Candidatus Mancarchaeum acidiphilum TaxID=1920749 RepID=A0A218NLY3_9ARCH|nr:hypothetical protein [Candidatus Mancarchaeum acidiphilum]ASI13461.1 preprotein translocase subunit SecD [Candidatus Mancarchaeum acidiphilum]